MTGLFSRRSIAAGLLGLLSGARSAYAGPSSESVYTISADATVTFTQSYKGCDCARPVVTRSGNTFTATTRCLSPVKARAIIQMSAAYQQSGEAIGSCRKVASLAPRKRVSLRCTISAAPAPQLPVTISGIGPTVSDLIQLPGGRLMATISFGKLATYYDLYLFGEDGSTYNFFYGDALTASKQVVVDVEATGLYRLFGEDADSDAAWSVTFSDAFP